MIFGRQKYDFLKTLVRVEMFENKLRIERKTGTVCYIIIGGKKTYGDFWTFPLFNDSWDQT